MADETVSATDVPEVPDYVAENYEALVADKNRNLTFKKVADDADESGDKALAAWARKRAAGKKDVTPTEATSAPKKVERLAQDKKGEFHPVKVDTVEPLEGVDEPEKDTHK